MGHRQKVPPVERIVEPVFLFVTSLHANLYVSGAFVQQPGDQFGLEAETERIRSPAHDVVAQVQRAAIVIADVMAANEVDEKSIEVRDPHPNGGFTLDGG